MNFRDFFVGKKAWKFTMGGFTPELSDEQMRKIWPFSLLNDEQMSKKVGVKHQPVFFLKVLGR